MIDEEENILMTKKSLLCPFMIPPAPYPAIMMRPFKTRKMCPDIHSRANEETFPQQIANSSDRFSHPEITQIIPVLSFKFKLLSYGTLRCEYHLCWNLWAKALVTLHVVDLKTANFSSFISYSLDISVAQRFRWVNVECTVLCPTQYSVDLISSLQI